MLKFVQKWWIELQEERLRIEGTYYTKQGTSFGRKQSIPKKTQGKRTRHRTPIGTHRSGVPVDARGPDERPELVVDDGPVLRVVGLHRHLIELARRHGSLEGSFGFQRSKRCTLFAPIFGRTTKLSSKVAMSMVRNVHLCCSDHQ